MVPFFRNLFLVTICFQILAEERAIKFIPGKTHGLFYFLDTISGNPHTSRTLKEIFQSSKHNTESARNELREFQRIIRRLPSFGFQGYPYSRHVGANVRELLVVQSIFSKSIDDFSERTLSLLPQESHKRVIAIMNKYKSIYNELIWKKSSKKLNEYVKDLDRVIHNKKLNESYKKAINFYGSSWPVESNFNVGVYGIDCVRGHTSAESLGSVQTIGICVDSKDFISQWGVIFHEMCHSFYQNQPAKFQKEIEEVFMSSKSKFSLKAYTFFNEVLATSLGNGWFYQVMTGELDNKKWYNNVYINGMAKEVYPKLESYLKKSKTLDKSFIESYISAFEKKFPNSIYEFESILSSIIVFSDTRVHDKNKFREGISKHFRVRSWSSYTNLNSSEVKKRITNSVGDSFIFLLNGLEDKRTQDILENVEFLKKNKDHIIKSKGEFLGMDSKGKAYIVLLNNIDGKYSELFEKYKQQKMMKNLKN